MGTEVKAQGTVTSRYVRSTTPIARIRHYLMSSFRRKERALFIWALCGLQTMLAVQVTGVSVETYYTDDGTVAGYPSGHATYRIYAQLSHATDRLTAVYGDRNAPLLLNVSGGGIWNHAVAGPTAFQNDCSLHGAEPAMAYDSYLAIGYACNGGSAAEVFALDDPNIPTWVDASFNTSPFGVDDVAVTSQVGALWYSLQSSPNTQAGEDQRVLVAQITTDGVLCGTLNFQVFPEYAGPGSPYIQQTGFVFRSLGGAITITPEVVPPTCHGDTDGSIVVTAAGGTGMLTYSFDEVTFDGTASLEGIGAGTYPVFVRDEAGCTVARSVRIPDPDSLWATADVSSITCHDSSDGSIHVDHNGGSGAVTFSIDGTNYSTSPDFVGLPEGTYQIHVMDANGCTSDPDTEIILVNPDVLEVTGLESIDITGTLPGGNSDYMVLGGVAPYTFHWTDAEGNIVSVSQNLPPLSDPVGAGIYTLTVMDHVGCILTTAIEVGTTVGVEDLDLGHTVEVFPNPTPGLLSLRFRTTRPMDVTYRITDTSGRNVYSSRSGIIGGVHHETLDISYLAAGVYFLRTETGYGSRTERIIKHSAPSVQD